MMIKNSNIAACLLLTICLGSLSCSSPTRSVGERFLDRSAASTKITEINYAAPPHIVFFIHGYRDDGSAWQNLPEIIAQKYASHNLRVKRLEYPSIGSDASQELHSYQFAQIIKAEIVSFLIEEQLKDLNHNKINNDNPNQTFKHPVSLNTTYTIVAHSQGGIVAMNYLNSCMMTRLESVRADNRCSQSDGISGLERADGQEQIIEEKLDRHLRYYENRPTPPNIRNLVTFGTPFWGSPMANALETPLRKRLTGLAREEIPKVQTENLATGSRSTSLLRLWLLNRPAWQLWDGHNVWKSRYSSSLRVYNMAGYIGDLIKNKNAKEIAVNLAFTPAEHELDLVVTPSEARPDFLFNIENPTKDRPSFVGRTHLSNNFAPINAIHAPLLGKLALTGVTPENSPSHPAMTYLSKILDSTLAELSQSTEASEPTDSKNSEVTRIDNNNDDYNNVKTNHLSDNLNFFSNEEKQKLFMKKISNFTNEFKLITPIGYHRKFIINKKKIKITPEKPDAFVALIMDNALLSKVSGYNSTALRVKHHYYQTYFHSGKFTDQNSFFPINEDFPKNPEGFNLNYEVEVFGFEPKSFSMKTLASFNSYGEFFIKPHLPIPSSTNRIHRDLLIAALSSKDKVRVLTLDSALRLQAKDFAMANLPALAKSQLDRCHLGLRALGTPDSKEEQGYIGAGTERRLQIRHQGNLYREVLDIQESETLDVGAGLELLGRYTSGFMDPRFQFGRECTDPEIAEHEEAGSWICNERSIDRYLVTSPKLREADQTDFANLRPGKGLRWINVVDVDAATVALPVLSDPDISTAPLFPPDQCIKDQLYVRFQAPSYYLKYFYSP